MKRTLKYSLLTMTLAMLLTGCSCKHEAVTSATCTTDSICEDCGQIMAPALGHTELIDDCEADVICSICNEFIRPGTQHTPGDAATCTSPQLCTVCDKELKDPLPHTPSGEENCSQDVTCTVCGELLAKASHLPANEVNCIDDVQCMRCLEVLEKATGHTAVGNTCSSCGVTMTLDETSPEGSYIHETVKGAHYNAYGDHYYSGIVYVCGDYGVEYYTLSDQGNAVWAQGINDFAKRFPDIKVSAMIVPKACAYETPDDNNASYESQRAFIDATYAHLDGVTAVDAMALMDEHDGEYMFYRSDHHWTSLGAYYASVAFCRANDILPRTLSSYETIVQTGAIGTLYQFGRKPAALLSNPDYTVYHLPLAEYKMTIGGTELPMINTQTKHYASGFIYGDNPMSVITTNNTTGRNLIIFKESYGNCFAPFMADYFDTIIVADMRYFENGLDQVVNDYNITHALIMNNSQAVDVFCYTVDNVLKQ